MRFSEMDNSQKDEVVMGNLSCFIDKYGVPPEDSALRVQTPLFILDFFEMNDVEFTDEGLPILN